MESQAMEETLEQTCQRIVRQDVHLCVSSLVNTLKSGSGCTIGDRDKMRRDTVADLSALIEQAAELSYPVDDYEEAAIQAGFSELANGNWARKEQDGLTEFDDARSACEALDLEPYASEVYEHWAVSSWLADKLEAQGERVDRDFAGLIVWARTTTGQAIAMDGVIERIAEGIRATIAA
jgi:hypothetical protein